MTDGELIEQIRTGNRDAFRILIERHAGRVHTLAWRVAGNTDDARDIAQEVFVKLHASLGSYDDSRPFTTWLFRLTVNCAIDYRRKRLRRHEVTLESFDDLPAESASAPADSMEHDDLTGAIARSMRGLTDRQRAVLVLRDMEEHSTAQTALILGCTESTVRVHLAQARERMREALRKLYPERFSTGMRTGNHS